MIIIVNMFKLLVRISLIILVCNQLLPCDALQGFANGGYNNGRTITKNQETQPKTMAGVPASLPGTTTRRGLGLSAWGIVTVIVSMIMAIVGMYYFSICYPILCKKTRKYDMIGLPNVA